MIGELGGRREGGPITAAHIRRTEAILADPSHPDYPQWAKDRDDHLRHATDLLVAPMIAVMERFVAAGELHKYLRAISPDLPLPAGATGWLVDIGYMRRAKRFVIKVAAINRAFKPVVRWLPFGTTP